MIITLITEKTINSITLPEKVRGQYWLYDYEDNRSVKLVSIEGLNGEWILKSNKKNYITDSAGTVIKGAAIKPLSIFKLKTMENKSVYVFAEPVTDDRQTFTKYIATDNIELTIGRNENNSIMLNNKFISSNHAVLSYNNGNWFINDSGSTNGTFVNGKRVTSSELKVGDIIYMMGFKMIVGNHFVAFNNPDNQMVIKSGQLRLFVGQKIEEADEDEEYELPEKNYFYRSPRFKRDIETAVFKIDSPPQNAIGEEMPLMMVIGPSMTMGMASLTTAIFAINNAMSTGNIKAAVPSIVMSCSMLLGTVMWPLITKNYEKKRKHKKEALRQKRYREYLDEFAGKINDECERQEEILNENYVPIDECIDRINNIKRNLWERGFGQNDFLRLRVGLGNGLLDAEISYSERKFTIEDDNLQEELYTLCEKPKVLNNIPITFSLFDYFVSGVIGKRKRTLEFAKGLIFQIASLYSYDEVKMVFIYDENEEESLEFVKWLPHVWSNDNKFRFIATTNSEVKEVSAYLEKEIENRMQVNDSEFDDVKPYYVIFSLSKQLSVRAEMLKQIYSKKKNLHMSVVTFYDELMNLPKECTMVVELDGENGRLFDKNDISGKFVTFKPDISLNCDPTNLSIRLANVELDTLANSFKLPSMITFLEMFGVGKVEHLNALTRWKDNDPTKTLEAAVGVDTLGEVFKLDLHEKFHGPHGLVAGMTGSGKSEFIITYILSLAVNYHPDEVAFILIDYKGGGMAKSFENLPHTAGIITNLDGSAIKRSLISIESELKRRQAIFAEASKKIGVSNIDIYKYQKLYREKTVTEPLQHLFIISDEFAELKTQQPEFMAQLVSAARIGRSLGVHLILATQKPSGVVDDQIWSNSKFRVCLKVQERADSMDMLKRPEAAELTDTGRFYLQVGYNELFELGQSAWAGAPYYPADKVQIEKDNSVVVIDKNGRIIRQAKVDKKQNQFGNAKKQLDVITDYLKGIADEENIKVRPLWLEPIPEIILLNDIKKKYAIQANSSGTILNPVIGEYDDPARQQQCILRLPISEEGNVVVYGVAGSGKTTFLNTMIYSLIQEHTPRELNIYILDFASETLRAFAKAPHVGDVILSHEGEKISNLFKMILKEIEKRKKLFADYGGDYKSYIDATGNILPSIVIVINNFAAFTEIYEEKEEAIGYLSREGTKYGIYFVLTALGTGAVRFRLLQNFKQMITLQLNDESDYATVVGKTEGLFPAKFRGRGLIRKDNLYEFQTANITGDAVPYSFIQNECEKIRNNWNGDNAKKIPILPEIVDYEFLSQYMNNSNNIPIGVEKASLNVHYYAFADNYINMVSAGGDEYKQFVYELSQFLAGKYKYDVTLIDSMQNYNEKDNENLTYYSTAKECENAVDSLFDLVLYRNNTYKEAIENGTEIEKFEQKYVFINSLSGLKSLISEEHKEKLNLILEKGEARYAITFIIAESTKNVSAVSFDKWYKKHVSQSDGLWIGSGIADQYLMKPSKMTSDLHDDITTDFGYSLKKGKAVRVKVLKVEQEGDDYDE